MSEDTDFTYHLWTGQVSGGGALTRENMLKALDIYMERQKEFLESPRILLVPPCKGAKCDGCLVCLEGLP